MDIKMNYRIDSVLCLIDAKNILTQLERKVQGEGTVNEAVQQLAFADSVIINKTDLVDADKLKLVKEKVNSVNAFARVITAEKVGRNVASFLQGSGCRYIILMQTWVALTGTDTRTCTRLSLWSCAGDI